MPDLPEARGDSLHPAPDASAASHLTVDWAVEVVARMAIFGALDNIEWGDYPEIGEYDWQQVQDRIAVISCGLKPLHDDYIEAYAVLESRAEKEAEGA